MARMNSVLLYGQIMPDASKLSIATGQLGPVCAITGKAMTFAEAVVLDDKFVCWEAYVEVTGADSASDGKYVSDLNLE